MKRRTRKWVLFAASVAGVLVGIVLLMALVGLLLPSRHTASATLHLSQPVDSVWAVVRDLGSYPSWWADLSSAQRLGDAGPREVWLQRDRHNQRMPIEVTESQAPRRLVTRIADETLPFGGTWTYEIEPTPAGCTLTITERGEVRNPVFRFMSRFVFGHYATIESYLEALARRFGEEPAITRDAAP